MCLNPIKIKIQNNGLCTKYRSKWFLESPLVTEIFSQEIEVPCRHCAECVMQKQKDYSQFLTMVAKQRGSLVFATLTYAPEHLPICECRLNDSYTDNYKDYEFVRFVEDEHPEDFSSMNRPIPVESDYRRPSDFSQYYRMASLRRSDFTLAMKRARIDYKRKYKKDSKVKYFLVGEYGSKKGRPHYHVLFFGCEREFWNIFSEIWRKTYGFCNLSKMTLASGDIYVKSTQHKVAWYVSKYVTKGDFDFRYKGAVEPSRIVSSSYLLELNPEQIAYYRCYDVIKEMELPDDWTQWTDLETEYYCARVESRMQVNGFPMSGYVRNKVWRDVTIIDDMPKKDTERAVYEFDEKGLKIIYYDYEKESKVVYYQNELSYLCKNFARMRLDYFLLQQCESITGIPIDSLCSDKSETFEDFKKNKKEDTAKTCYEQLAKFYHERLE